MIQKLKPIVDWCVNICIKYMYKKLKWNLITYFIKINEISWIFSKSMTLNQWRANQQIDLKT